MRLPATIVGSIVFALIAASNGLIAAGGGFALSQLVIALLPSIGWETAFVGSIALSSTWPSGLSSA